MAAKSKKRLSKIENKLLKSGKFELKDVVCSICQSILIEPVTLPCFHCFCQRCFNGSIENNALCCPLCRLRIGSWLRTATKQKNLVNDELWSFMKIEFSQEIDRKLKGDDVSLPLDKPILRLSAPGEIRSEYEAELKRLRAERLQLEQKHLHETTRLIEKIQEEEREAQKRYLERLKQDELLAKQIQKGSQKNAATSKTPKKQNVRRSTTNSKPKLKATRIDSYLSKIQAPVIESPLLTDDNTSTDSSTPLAAIVKPYSRPSPEMVPSYGRLLKNLIDKKIKTNSSFWNKENGDKLDEDGEKKEDPQPSHKEINSSEDKSKEKSKGVIKSLLVSLPLPCPGVLQHKTNVTANRNLETGSVDSMHQELCYFKPIEKTSPTSFKVNKSLPLRVPCKRVGRESSGPSEAPPSRDQYIEGLCRLRNMSLANNLPSAFVIALNILRVNKESPVKSEANTRAKTKKNSVSNEQMSPVKKNSVNKNKQITQVDGITKINYDATHTQLRRTRSMGSISKDENETTPKKAKIQERKAVSDRKPHLRSDSKRLNAKKRLNSSPELITKTINNNKVNFAVKNLSSPLENCDVKKILQEQIRIEKIIEQEKSDLELARKMEAEWNGRRQPQRSAVKRQITLNYALRPAKKLKV